MDVSVRLSCGCPPLWQSFPAGKKAENSDAWKLFIPNVNLNAVLYSGYSMGLTVFILFTAVYMMIKSRKSERFLPVILICCIIFPLINYTMNAFMYIDGKSFIPLEPVMLLITGNFLSEKRLDPKYTVASSAVIIAMGSLNALTSDYNNELRILWIPIFVSVIFTSFLMMWIYQKIRRKFCRYMRLPVQCSYVSSTIMLILLPIIDK